LGPTVRVDTSDILAPCKNCLSVTIV